MTSLVKSDHSMEDAMSEMSLRSSGVIANEKNIDEDEHVKEVVTSDGIRCRVKLEVVDDELSFPYLMLSYDFLE